jgi:hypothetical protein
MKVLDRPSGRMLAMVTQHRAALVDALGESADLVVARAVAVLVLRGLAEHNPQDGVDVTRDLGDGWSVTPATRAIVRTVFPVLAEKLDDPAREGPVVVIGDDLGSRKLAVASRTSTVRARRPTAPRTAAVD